jgi:hypothetical protein
MGREGEVITFGDLNVGDLFNTKVARWVKTGDTMAIVVVCGVSFAFDVGEKHVIANGQEVILLWSSNSELKRRKE